MAFAARYLANKDGEGKAERRAKYVTPDRLESCPPSLNLFAIPRSKVSRKKERELHTNVDDLLKDDIDNGRALKQEVQPPTVATNMEVRSTIDPVAVQLASVTMAENIDRASPRIRGWAWVLMAAPPLVVWCVMVYQLATRPDPPELAHAVDYKTGLPYTVDHTMDWIISGLTLLPALYWPYMLLRPRRKKTSS